MDFKCAVPRMMGTTPLLTRDEWFQIKPYQNLGVSRH